MEFKRLDKRKGSGAASIRSRYAYLIHLPDIDYFPETNEKGVRLEGDIVLKDGRTMIPVYLTNPSQEYSYDTQGADDEKTFRVKFTGTHPGTELEALEFSKNLIEESFLILIPSCDKNTPGKLLGQIENPMIFTSTHKAAKDGDKFTFSFEQRIGSEFIYFSYGGIISLPPGGDDPDIPVPPSPGFDPTKWARRDASNIDGENVLLWREALRIYNEDKVLTIGSITATTTTLALDLHTSGVNSVLMSGVERSKTEGDDFTFAPVSAGKLKYVLLYALPDPQLFHIIEGVEGNEAIYPDLPPGALLIKAVLISEFGALLEDADGGYKPLAEDPWRNIVINSNAAVNIIVASSPSSSFNVMVGAGVTAPKIAAIKTKVKKNTRDGQEITIYNDSDTPVALLPGDYEETLVYTTFPFADNYEIKPRSFAKFKRKENKYHELAGGGSASFPEGAAPGDVLTEGTEGPEWSNRLTNVETNKQDKSMFSALVDKWLHMWDATTQKMQPILKFVSGVVNQLEFTGRIKTDAIVLPNNTNPVVANRLRSNGSRLKYADDLSVEKDIAFTEDITNGSSLLQRYIHNSNIVLEPTAVDYATANITVPSHGLNGAIGSTVLAGAVPNSFFLGNLTAADWSSIPVEWTTNFVRLKIIDANTLQVCSTPGTAIPVNISSTENNGKLDFTKWHIEISKDVIIGDFPVGIRSVEIKYYGLLCNISTDQQFLLRLYDANNNIYITENVYDQAIGRSCSVRFYMGNAIGLALINMDVSFTVYKGLNKVLYTGFYSARGSGASNFTAASINQTSPSWASRMLLINETNGIAGLKKFGTASLTFNGTVIEVYKK